MDWDSAYQESNTPWDKGAAAPPLEEWLAGALPLASALSAGRWLSPGCGLGYDVRALAERLPDASFVGADISPTALNAAREFENPTSVQFRELDIFALPENEKGGYDAVWEHTCFCAIDPARRDAYVAAMAEVLRPDGVLIGVFFINPYDEDHPIGSGPPFGVEVEALKQHFSPYFVEQQSFVPQTAYPGREGRERFVIFQKS